MWLNNAESPASERLTKGCAMNWRLSDEEVVLSVFAAGGEDKVQKISMRRYGAEWKMAGPKRE